MQRSYRVRDDLAHATMTKFLLETNYLSLRRINRLDINIYTLNILIWCLVEFWPQIRPACRHLWLSKHEFGRLNTGFISRRFIYISDQLALFLSRSRNSAIIKGICSVKKTQWCDLISLDACTRVCLKLLHLTLNFWHFITYFHDTFNFLTKRKYELFPYSVARIFCNIY